MNSLFFWSLFILVPIFSLAQLRVAGERINQVSIVNVTAVALYLFSILGTLPLFYFLDEYRYDFGIQDKELVLVVLFYSSINIVFFLFGVIFFRNVLGLKPVNFRSEDMRRLGVVQIALMVVVFLICVFFLFVYLTKVEEIAIIVAFTEGADAAKQARSNMGNSFPGKYHWYQLIMHDFGNLLTFASFAFFLERKKLSRLIAFVIAFSYSAFVALMATEKAPIAWLLVGLFMVYFLVKNDGFIPFRKLMLFVFFIVLVLMTAYFGFMGSRDLGSALWSVFSRAFSGGISPAYFYLQYFPEHQEYLWGRTFPNPGGLMPYEPYRYTVEVMNWMNPKLLGSGVVGTAPTVFWGESYANFGPWAIPLIAFIIGCLVSAVSYAVSKIEVNPISISFIVWFALAFKKLASTGFSGYFYSIYIVFTVLLVAFLFFIRGYFILRKR